MLDLSQQPLLQQPGSLQPLLSLLQLSSLNISLSGSALHLPLSSWASLARLTSLRQLDVSGCALCYFDSCLCYNDGAEGCGCSQTDSRRGSCSGACDAAVEGDRQKTIGQVREACQCQCRQQQRETAAAAAAGQKKKLVAALLQQLSSLQQLQRLVLADWHQPPSAAGASCCVCCRCRAVAWYSVLSLVFTSTT